LLAPQVGADVVEQMELEYARAIVEQMAPATVTQSAQFKNGSGDPRWRAWQRIWFGVYSV
jgi:hypothetical protein